jgi:hypothetical protein
MLDVPVCCQTTLLDVLAGRKNSGLVEGDIRVAGHPKDDATFARVSGFVEQVSLRHCSVLRDRIRTGVASDSLELSGMNTGGMPAAQRIHLTAFRAGLLLAADRHPLAPNDGARGAHVLSGAAAAGGAQRSGRAGCR